jgi:hypothetical protein
MSKVVRSIPILGRTKAVSDQLNKQIKILGVAVKEIDGEIVPQWVLARYRSDYQSNKNIKFGTTAITKTKKVVW